jgi:hypothetical protein
MQNDVKISVIATGFDQTRPLRRIEQPIYRRQIESRPAERPAPQAVSAPAMATVGAKSPEKPEKKFDPDDLEVPSFLRRK